MKWACLQQGTAPAKIPESLCCHGHFELWVFVSLNSPAHSQVTSHSYSLPQQIQEWDSPPSLDFVSSKSLTWLICEHDRYSLGLGQWLGFKLPCAWATLHPLTPLPTDTLPSLVKISLCSASVLTQQHRRPGRGSEMPPYSVPILTQSLGVEGNNVAIHIPPP